MPPNKLYTEPISVYFTAEQKRALENRSLQEGRPVGWIIRRALFPIDDPKDTIVTDDDGDPT